MGMVPLIFSFSAKATASFAESKQYASEIRINDISKFIIEKFKGISQLLIKLNIKRGKAITKYDTFFNSLTWLNSSAMMFYLDWS